MFFMLMNKFKPMDWEIGTPPPSLKEVVCVPQATVVEMLNHVSVLRAKCTHCTLAFERLIRIYYINVSSAFSLHTRRTLR